MKTSSNIVKHFRENQAFYWILLINILLTVLVLTTIYNSNGHSDSPPIINEIDQEQLSGGIVTLDSNSPSHLSSAGKLTISGTLLPEISIRRCSSASDVPFRVSSRSLQDLLFLVFREMPLNIKK